MCSSPKETKTMEPSNPGTASHSLKPLLPSPNTDSSLSTKATATMAALRLLLLGLALLLLPFALQLHTIAASGSSDGDHLLAAKSALSDPTGALAGWQPGSGAGSPCAWKHVSCSGNATGAVVRINISNLSLSGRFPAALCSLQSLRSLNLSSNDLTGPLPACLAALPALTHLYLAGNGFSGEVPPAWGAGFRSLVALDLVANQVTGAFPAFLTNVTALRDLQLAYNPFSPSPLPASIADLADLRVLYVARCNLIGNIPSSIGRLRNLVNLDLSSNNLVGEIPGAIANLTSVEQIELYSNNLTGRIPVGLGGLSNLRRLDFAMNWLNGNIPEDLFTAPLLESVHLYQNNLTGRLPATLGTMASLSDLRIFSNLLEGPLPTELGKNCPLALLDVSDNRLSGPIPATVCAGGKLAQLLLLDNKLEGAIPAELGQCWALNRVRLHNNRLSGPVPPEFWGLPGLQLLELHGNALSGTVDPSIGGSNLSSLLIQDNRFTGALPAELGMLPLGELTASNNGFSGPLPPWLGDLIGLYKLDLSRNNFSSLIPPEFGKLKNLTLMNLSNNQLSGSIPPELGGMGRTNSLDLSYNNLSGGLPEQLENLQLTSFNVSCNKLSGLIPPYFSAPTFKESFLGNPGLCRNCQNNFDSGSNQRTLIRSIIGVLIASTVILLISVTWFAYKCITQNNSIGSELSDAKSKWTLTSFHTVDFSERDIVNSLTDHNVIGQGASGKVYRVAVGPNGEAMAVKKLWVSGDEGSRNDTFEAEVETLSKVRHKNIVKLVCCVTNRVCRLLVYEYMPSGSLGDILHCSKNTILIWPMRYNIACDAAEGLRYLHHDCSPPIIHRDVKSNNILLDAEYRAKVADFGVAKAIGNGPATMSVIAGSHGYIAPEYAYTLRVNEKSDIYSFGVVLLELVTGKKPLAPEIDEMDLVSWVASNVQQNGPESVLDKIIPAVFKVEMCKVLRIGQLCVSNHPSHRPPMRVVVKMLQEIRGASQPKVFPAT